MTSTSSAAQGQSPQGPLPPQTVHRTPGIEPLDLSSSPTPSAPGKPDGSSALELRPLDELAATGVAEAPHAEILPRHDPTTGTPIPPKGSPSHILKEGLRTHFDITQGISQSLVSDRTVLPEGFSRCIDEVVKLTPKEPLGHQRRELRKLRDPAKSSKADDEDIVDKAPRTVRSAVLMAASPSGLKVALLHKYTSPSSGTRTRTTSRGI